MSHHIAAKFGQVCVPAKFSSSMQILMKSQVYLFLNPLEKFNISLLLSPLLIRGSPPPILNFDNEGVYLLLEGEGARSHAPPLLEHAHATQKL